MKILPIFTKIATDLDLIGDYKTANQLDALIKLAGERTGAVDDFVKELRKAFITLSTNENVPSINEGNIDIILGVIDTLVNSGHFLNPASYVSSDFGEEANVVAQEMKELVRSVKKLKEQLEKAGEEDKVQIQKELTSDEAKLAKLKIKVSNWKNGRRNGDKEKYETFQKLMG